MAAVRGYRAAQYDSFYCANASFKAALEERRLNICDWSDHSVSHSNPHHISCRINPPPVLLPLPVVSATHLRVLYGPSPSAKEKYSNLKQLVGCYIVKRNNKKKTYSRCHLGEMNNCGSGRGFKGAPSPGQSDLEGQRAYMESVAG